MSNPHEHTNKLINTASPYLLQHAHNPVDWYPWGEEAFDKARAENKPIFLSIGYSACHWCHVMERESFENDTVAAFLNERFVSIKVDREERPDVDDIYMTAVQMMTGSGGWPLTLFLTNDLKPFYGGTYFPPDDRYGRPGFLRLLQMIDDFWKNRSAEVNSAAQSLVEALQKHSIPLDSSKITLNPEFLDQTARSVARSFDPFRGGFGEAPKFPPTAQMEMLLRTWKRTGNAEYLEMVERTLRKMSEGGINDQLGGGFARYSTDADWLVPHFEKMLYDNALLVVNLIDCGLATGKPEYIETAKKTLNWALSEMRDEKGGFHSSLDADSEGEEGKYYVWTPKEVETVLGAEDARIFGEIYDVSDSGNFEHGKSILHLAQPLKEASLRYNIGMEELADKLDMMKAKLLAERRERIAPAKDDKVLTDWNGLMIIALARGYRATGDDRYLVAAQEATAFIKDVMLNNGILMHSYRQGRIGAEGTLDDYGYYLAALVELYQADFNTDHLNDAEAIVELLRLHFHDNTSGGFFMTPEGKSDLITRTKTGHDGSSPSGNAMIASSLIKLYQLLDREDYRLLAAETVDSFSGIMSGNPVSHLRLALCYEMLTFSQRQTAVIGDPKDLMVRNLLVRINSGYHPTMVIGCGEAKEGVIALLKDRSLVDGKPAAYVCHDFVCEAPVTDIDALGALLK